MKKSFLRLTTTLLFLYGSVIVCNGQFIDNFSDGDFANNPVWIPDDFNNWTVLNGQLRSNSALGSSSFYISTASSIIQNAQWEFLINLQFNTSSANYVDVFLVADQADLKSPTINGYFVRIGGTPDEVSLFKVVAGVSSILINGQDGVTNASSSTLRIKVMHTNSGDWNLFRDAIGGTNYVSEGTANDATFSTSSFFGIRITQSVSSFFQKHFFDDFYVGDIILDTTPPQVQTVKVTSSTELEIQFNEKIESASALELSNYQVNNTIGQPTNAQILADEKTIVLTFSKNFPSPAESEITINNVNDLEGNTMTPTKFTFYYFDKVAAQTKDVIITELFPDPNPVVGLPEAEFIEIYNRSANAFDLQNWKITDGSSTGILPSYILKPGDYVILCSTTSFSLFQSFGKTISISNFPTLNNSSDNISLKSALDGNIDQVNYTDDWYKDEDKSAGGWTLELIDPENICAEEENWVASENIVGGTPGKQNSVYANKPDLTGPQLISVSVISPTELKVVFNEKLENQIPPLQNFSISPLVSIQSVSFLSTSLRELTLELTSPLQASQLYEITVASIYDCAGNVIQSDFSKVEFALPEEAVVGDVLINEILFNPRPYGVDFVEIYNASNKFLNLKEWKIGNYEAEILTDEKIIAVGDQLLLPKQFLVLTTDPITLQSHYPQAISKNVLKVKSLPSWPDEEGSVAISTSAIVLDHFNYSKEMQSPLLKDKEGVSLERISFTQATSDFQNWQSASSVSGFATPGFQNSNARGEITVIGSVKVDPEIFEPITGQPNSTQILYNFDKGGLVASIKIYDLQGHEVKEIARQVTVGTEGFFKWEGDRNDGTRASLGYYIVWMEVFDSTGQIQTFRKRVVLSSRL